MVSSNPLVQRLRAWNGNSFGPYKSPVPDLLEAADEIDRLSAELATLRNEAGDSDFEWQDEFDTLEAALRSATSREASLFAAIAHGDDTHRAWLKQAIEDHFAGRPVQPAVGLGRKEAMLREALAKHGRHGRDCDITLYGNDPGVIIECTCGLDDALAGAADEPSEYHPLPFWHECEHFAGWTRDADYQCQNCAPPEFEAL